jgi:hypothetical protein
LETGLSSVSGLGSGMIYKSPEFIRQLFPKIRDVVVNEALMASNVKREHRVDVLSRTLDQEEGASLLAPGVSYLQHNVWIRAGQISNNERRTRNAPLDVRDDGARKRLLINALAPKTRGADGGPYPKIPDIAHPGGKWHGDEHARFPGATIVHPGHQVQVCLIGHSGQIGQRYQIVLSLYLRSADVRTVSKAANGERKAKNRTAREVEYDQKKYISVRVAARLLGLSHTTLYQWAQKGQASNGARLDVIKDTLTNQMLVSEKSIRSLMASRFRPVLQEATSTESST